LPPGAPAGVVALALRTRLVVRAAAALRDFADGDTGTPIR